MTTKFEFRLFFFTTLMVICVQGCISTKSLLESKKQIRIIAGMGFADFQIGSTTKAYVIKRLGNAFIDTTYLYPSRQLKYDRYGISFIYGSNDTIWDIIFYFPFNGITDHGIILNESTMKDVENAYGELSWQMGYPFTHCSSIYPGIEYQVKNVNVGKAFPLDKDKHINRTIIQIEVFDNKHFYNKDRSKESSP